MSRERAKKREYEILNAARDIFSEKGFADTTISEIAQRAGVANSAVYKVFKGKEDLLFSVPKQDIEFFFEDIGRHIEGIYGAKNKLGKLIWYHCQYFTTNLSYTRILLLECRSNPKFYNADGYELIKIYSNLILKIIEEGKTSGEIDPSVSSRLVRDMIMGTIDHVALWWIMKKGPSPLEKWEHIFRLVWNSINYTGAVASPNGQRLGTKGRIIDSATKIFAKKGFSNTTIAAIAQEAGVAEGTIYEYYESKEHLFLNIPEERLNELVSYIDDAAPQKQLERIILFCFRFYNNNKEFTSILTLMLRPNQKFYVSASHVSIERIANKLIGIVEAGKSQGIFSPDVDPDTFIAMVFGTIDHIVIPWIIFNRKYRLLDRAEDATKLLLRAIMV